VRLWRGRGKLLGGIEEEVYGGWELDEEVKPEGEVWWKTRHDELSCRELSQG